LADGTFRLGAQDGPAQNRAIIGHGVSSSPDASLLVSLLPRVVHVRHEKRLATLVHLLRDEAREQRPARDVILARLLEIVFIEALRSSETSATPGLVRALADPRLAQAIRCMHQQPGERWTVAQLATAAALSRSAFFERFTREVGVAPMEYLLGWRMALAKSALRNGETGIAVIAERVGYSSASAFSVAFTRQVGVTPTQYGKQWRARVAA
jgi:AraC-like DNA-binding protein